MVNFCFAKQTKNQTSLKHARCIREPPKMRNSTYQPMRFEKFNWQLRQSKNKGSKSFGFPPKKMKDLQQQKTMPNKILASQRSIASVALMATGSGTSAKILPFGTPRQEGLGMLHRENCQKKHTALIVGDFTRELDVNVLENVIIIIPIYLNSEDSKNHGCRYVFINKLFQILRLLIFWLKIFQAKGLFFCLFWISRFPPSRGMGLQRLGSPDRISWGSRQLGIWPTMSWLSASFFWV